MPQPINGKYARFVTTSGFTPQEREQSVHNSTEAQVQAQELPLLKHVYIYMFLGLTDTKQMSRKATNKERYTESTDDSPD